MTNSAKKMRDAALLYNANNPFNIAHASERRIIMTTRCGYKDCHIPATYRTYWFNGNAFKSFTCGNHDEDNPTTHMQNRDPLSTQLRQHEKETS